MKTLASLLLVTQFTVLATQAMAAGPLPSRFQPGYKTVFVPEGTPDKVILLELVAKTGRTPEGFVFHVCEGEDLSENCPLLLANGIVIPVQDLVDGTTGPWNSFKAYVEVASLIGLLVGANAESVASYGGPGLVNLVTASPFEQFRRAKFAHNIIKDALRNARSSEIVNDTRVGTEAVPRQFDDLNTDILLMLFGILAHEQKNAKPGSVGYANKMAINDYINEKYRATKEKEAKCAADPSSCADKQ